MTATLQIVTLAAISVVAPAGPAGAAKGADRVTSPNTTAEVRAEVTGLNEKQADVVAALCTSDEFQKMMCKDRARASTVDGRASFVFSVLPGRYGIAVFHDLFQDGRIHKSPLGLPKQGVGFSNNPLLFGSPSFDRIAFVVPRSGISIRVRLQFEPTSYPVARTAPMPIIAGPQSRPKGDLAQR